MHTKIFLFKIHTPKANTLTTINHTTHPPTWKISLFVPYVQWSMIHLATFSALALIPPDFCKTHSRTLQNTHLATPLHPTLLHLQSPSHHHLIKLHHYITRPSKSPRTLSSIHPCNIAPQPCNHFKTIHPHSFSYSPLSFHSMENV